MARWIGIDYGIVRTGLAHTDPTGVLAFPYKTVPTTELIAAITALVNEAPCAGFALGIPNRWGLDSGRGLTDSSAPILAFKKQLEQQFPTLDIILVDETNTSEEALQAAIQSGMKKTKRSKKGAVDDVAAALILQRFLDDHSC
ncbi:MAG: Holliday junction resolvase RuvX [Flavobacteriales bacterium]|nr:Holliday junction resolvase RuvX [Flavobacteriales bacterium]